MKKKILGLTALLFPFFLMGQTQDPILLNTLAVTNETGAIVVSGTEGSYDGKATTAKEAVFDGVTSTFFDPTSADAKAGGCWAGIQLQKPMTVTKIRYFGRDKFAWRVPGLVFQGANQPDFSDAVTLHVAAPPSNWNGLSWREETVSLPSLFIPFTYLRVYGTTPYTNQANEEQGGVSCGNIAEVEFYGIEYPDPVTQAIPQPPKILFSELLNGKVNFLVEQQSDDVLYQLERKSAHEEAYSVVSTYFSAEKTNHWQDGNAILSDMEYRVCTFNYAGTSEYVTVSISWHHSLTGTVIGVEGAYNDDESRTRYALFDGNIRTFFDGPQSASPSFWAGMDFGMEQKVSKIRFIARSGWQSRMNDVQIQTSATADFANPLVVHTIQNAPKYPTVGVIDLSTPVTSRYVRCVWTADGWGNSSEIEFVTDRTPAGAIQNFSASKISLDDQRTQLSWGFSADAAYTGIRVYRATAPGGPWSRVMTNDLSHGVTNWIDDGMVEGIRYYYQLALVYVSEEGLFEGARTDALAANRKCIRLERNGDDMTKLREGVTAVRWGKTYAGPNGNSTAEEMATWDVPVAFDGSTSTFADIIPSNSLTTAMGVDFGESFHVDGIRIYPRQNTPDRVDGSVLYGSAVDGSNTAWRTDAVSISEPLAIPSVLWFYQETTAESKTNAYRTVFLSKPSANEYFYCNVAELEFFGWKTGTEAEDVLIAPESISFVPREEGLFLEWDYCANSEETRIERKRGTNEVWEVIVRMNSGTSFLDAEILPYDGTELWYRIVTSRAIGTNGMEEAYSRVYRQIPYVPGNGTGLVRAIIYPYNQEAYSAEEQVRSVVTNEMVNFHPLRTDMMVPGIVASSNYFLVQWSAKLIIPFDGDYTFRSRADNGVLVLMDGVPLFSRYLNSNSNSRSSRYLTKGEHDVLIYLAEITGDACCYLYWGGCLLEEELIPKTQWIPVAPPMLPVPWVRERTFGVPQFGWSEFRDDGSVVVHGAGQPLADTHEDYHYLWRTCEGSFDYSFRYEALSTNGNGRVMMLLRAGLEKGSPTLALTAAGGTCTAQLRSETGGTLSALESMFETAVDEYGWMRIKRYGDTFSCYVKSDGASDWRLFAQFTDEAGAFHADCQIGPAVSGSAWDAAQEAFSISSITMGNASGGTMMLLR